MSSNVIVDAIVNLFVGLSENDIAGYDDIFRVTGLRPPPYNREARIFYDAMKAAREILFETHNIRIKNVARLGYLYLDPEGRMEVAKDIIKKSKRLIEDGKLLLAKTDHTRLSRNSKKLRKFYISKSDVALRAFLGI